MRTDEQASEPLRDAVDRALAGVGSALDHLGADLRAGRAPQVGAVGDATLDANRTALGLDLPDAGRDPVVAALGQHLDALAGQLRAAHDLANSAIAGRDRLPSLRGAILLRQGRRARATDFLERLRRQPSPRPSGGTPSASRSSSSQLR